MLKAAGRGGTVVAVDDLPVEVEGEELAVTTGTLEVSLSSALSFSDFNLFSASSFAFL